MRECFVSDVVQFIAQRWQRLLRAVARSCYTRSVSLRFLVSFQSVVFGAVLAEYPPAPARSEKWWQSGSIHKTQDKGIDMTTSPSGFDPLWMFRAPWSGDVAQRITAPWFSPSLTVNYAGDAAVEGRVENSLVGLRRSQSPWPRDSHCPRQRCAVWKGHQGHRRNQEASPPFRR